MYQYNVFKKVNYISEDLDTTQETEEDQVPKGKFNWEGIIVHMLRKNDSELPMKKLRKKVNDLLQQMLK